MQSPDDKQYPLAKLARRQQPRRSVSKKDFALPKPYRRQMFSEEPERLTRLQVSLLGFAGVMVATLVGVLALMAHESERSPDGKLIVAAAGLEGADRRATRLVAFPPAPAVAAVHPAVAPVLRQIKNPLPPAARPRAAAPAKKPPQPARKAFVAARDIKARAARPPIAAPAPAPDADVALITAILLLTPAPAPSAAPAISMELAGHGRAACIAAVPRESNCSDVHKPKH